MKNILLLLCIAFIILGFGSCKEDNPVEPVAGKRDYTWTADTINTYMDAVDRIGGASINSLWGVGSSGNGNTVRKYDGTAWPAVTTFMFLSDAFTLGCANDNDMWAAGYEGYIWHYTGVWTQTLKYTETGIKTFVFRDFCVNSSTDIYLSGVAYYEDNRSRGIIMRYNGYTWKKVYHSDENSYYSRICKDAAYPDDYFIYSLKWSQVAGEPDTTTFLKYNGEKMQLIYTEPYQNYSPAILSSFGGRVYFGMKDGIYRYENNKLKIFVTLPVNSNDRYMAFGRSEKDLFIADRTDIMHYNGTDIEKILTFDKNQTYLDAAVFEKDIFILVTPDFSKYIIYHGTLKE